MPTDDAIPYGEVSDFVDTPIDESHNYEDSIKSAPLEGIDPLSGVTKYAPKAAVSSVFALLVALLGAIGSVGLGLTPQQTALAVIVAFSGAALTWVTPRASAGILAYTKLGIGLLTAAAQVIVPVIFTGEWSWGLVTIVATQLFSAYKVWETPDGKSPATVLHAKLPLSA